MDNIEKVEYLIIGNSAGGIGAVEAIRESDKSGTILIISDEPYPAYSKPLISEYLAEKRSVEEMLFRPADFYEKNGIATLLSTKARRLDIENHIVVCDDGKQIMWHKLLLATGGSSIMPSIKGIDKAGVFTFITLDDAKAISQFVNKMTRVVVIGGGLIGMSVTEALLKRKAKVTVVEMKDRVLNTMLDDCASAMVETALKKSGVDIITNHTVSEIDSYSGDWVTSVVLDDGAVIPCNMAIIAIGVKPRIELLTNTAVRVNRGIVVNRQMATSVPGIYACGDVAEAYDFIYGENRLTPIWPNAYYGGRIAGFNMAGVPAEYSGGTSMNSLKYFGLSMVSAGIVMPPDSSYETLVKKSGDIYRKVVLRNGFAVGMVFAGNIERTGLIYNLMKEKINVSEFKNELIADDFGLISLPDDLWRPYLTMPSDWKASATALSESNEKILVY